MFCPVSFSPLFFLLSHSFFQLLAWLIFYFKLINFTIADFSKTLFINCVVKYCVYLLPNNIKNDHENNNGRDQVLYVIHTTP